MRSKNKEKSLVCLSLKRRALIKKRKGLFAFRNGDYSFNDMLRVFMVKSLARGAVVANIEDIITPIVL